MFFLCLMLRTLFPKTKCLEDWEFCAKKVFESLRNVVQSIENPPSWNMVPNIGHFMYYKYHNFANAHWKENVYLWAKILFNKHSPLGFTSLQNPLCMGVRICQIINYMFCCHKQWSFCLGMVWFLRVGRMGSKDIFPLTFPLYKPFTCLVVTNFPTDLPMFRI
jgi:hypothetical protein